MGAGLSAQAADRFAQDNYRINSETDQRNTAGQNAKNNSHDGFNRRPGDT